MKKAHLTTGINLTGNSANLFERNFKTLQGITKGLGGGKTPCSWRGRLTGTEGSPQALHSSVLSTIKIAKSSSSLVNSANWSNRKLSKNRFSSHVNSHHKASIIKATVSCHMMHEPQCGAGKVETDPHACRHLVWAEGGASDPGLLGRGGGVFD